MVERLQKILSSQGPKALVGNRGYGRFLKMDRKGTRIDPKKIASEARFDGMFVLLTNSGLPTHEVATSYKNLWQVERAFSDLKSILEVRPVFHRTKRRITGHIFCNFLALYLKISLQKVLEAKGLKLPWDEVLGDLEAIKTVEPRLNGSSYLLRTDFRGIAH
jgi:transposase